MSIFENWAGGPYDDGLGPPHIHPDVQGMTQGPAPPPDPGAPPGEGGPAEAPPSTADGPAEAARRPDPQRNVAPGTSGAPPRPRRGGGRPRGTARPPRGGDS